MKLGTQQQEAFEKVAAWMKTDEKRFVLDGAAGTGKSTFASYVEDKFGQVHFCAYTGKAANVLRQKGVCSVSTIHEAIYDYLEDDEKDRPQFEAKEHSHVRFADLVIVDEYSMLPEDIVNDIEKEAKKILYLGDSFQLPPVKGICPLKPDFQLTDVHRQALESPILRAATRVREGKELLFENSPGFVYGERDAFKPEDYYNAEQIIVGYNKTRKEWNDRFRTRLGFSRSPFPVKGDKVIFTRNNRRDFVFNGMIGYIRADSKKKSGQQIDVYFEKKKKVKVWTGDFLNTAGKPSNLRLNRMEYAYAITAHKSQGSEFKDVLIYNQPIGKNDVERRRWLYTAITRGKEKVLLVEP